MSVEEESISLQDVLEEDQELESTANAVLGDSDDSKCSYSKGYVGRQALYACGTCINKTSEPAGICLACSLHCHEGHDLYELYTKRSFRCDCGNSKFKDFTCTLTPNKEALNSENKYNHNFQGLYCTCNRPYPDSEDDVEDEMIQCVVCEDWFHSRHLEGEAPPSYEEMVCDSCMQSCDFLRVYQQWTMPTKIVKESETNSSDLDVSNGPESGSRVDLDVTNGSESGSRVDLYVTNGSESGSRVGNETNKRPGSHSVVGRDAIESEDAPPNDCELLRRRKSALNQSVSSSSQKGAGYFDKKWRAQLCRCSTCKALYESSGCLFLLEEEDSLSAYEERARSYPNSHDAGVAALGTINHVQQVEAIHHYTELKSELSGFLSSFAQKRKVVSKEDIEGFFEEMSKRKQRRLETGDGVPPANCHF